jgi:hypothetical protein
LVTAQELNSWSVHADNVYCAIGENMSFDWLNRFHGEMEKADDYAEKTLAAYRLGMKAKGSIAGVRVEVAADGCDLAQALVGKTAVYHPDDAPHLPLPNCPKGRGCTCVYRPVMAYELGQKADD